MEALIRYVVYEFNMIMGNEKHLSLEKVNFKSETWNSFDTEEHAIEALIKDNMAYEEYVVLKQIYIRH